MFHDVKSREGRDVCVHEERYWAQHAPLFPQQCAAAWGARGWAVHLPTAHSPGVSSPSWWACASVQRATRVCSSLHLGPSLFSHLKGFLHGLLAEGLLLKTLHFVS